MTDVFISYSRKDKDFVQRLHKALEESGKAVWIDWENIPLTVDWLEEIKAGIEAADTFVYIISPDSVHSDVCAEELGYAIKNKKRLIPVMHRDLIKEYDQAALHPMISSHNWLFFRDQDDFDKAFTSLVDALGADIDHMKVHTRLLVKAKEWADRGKDSSLLLRGTDLQAAQTWLSTAMSKTPEPTQLHTEFIMTSHSSDNRRQRQVLIGVSMMAVVAVVLALFALFAQQAAVRAEAEAVSARNTAEREATVNDSIGLSNRARFLGRTGEEPLLGIGYAIQANTITDPPVEVQQTLADLVWQPGARRRLIGHVGQIWAVAYSPDGNSVFSGAGSFSEQPDNRLIEWNVATGEIIRELGSQADRIYSIAVSPDGRYIATGSQDRTVTLWDLETGERVYSKREHSGPVFKVIFTPDSSQIISGSSDAMIVWNVADGAVVNRFTGIQSDIVLSMDINEAGTLVFSGSFDGSIALWNLSTGEVLNRFSAGAITGAHFFGDESRGITSDQNGDLIVWNFAENKAVRTIRHDEAPLRGGFVITPDELVVAADDNGNVLVYDINDTSSDPIRSFRGHDGRITGIDISPSGTEVTTASFDFTLIEWDLLGRGGEVRRYTEDPSAVNSVDWNNDGTLVAAGGVEGHIDLWNSVDGQLVNHFGDGLTSIYQVLFSPDESLIASAMEDGTVILWDVATGTQNRIFAEHLAPVRALAFSADGTRLATAGGQVQVSDTRPLDNRVLIWDVATGEVVQTLSAHEAAVRALAFTPDGTGLLSASDDKKIILWDVQAGTEIRRYEGHTDAVWSLAFNPDGSQFLSGSRDTSIILWNTASGEQVRLLRQHNSGVRSLAFSPDGIHALSGAGNVSNSGVADDYNILYWDLQDDTIPAGTVLRRYPGHTQTIRSIVFNSDGTQAVSASDDGTIIQWYVDDLNGLMNRIGENYDVYCVGEITNPICKPDPRATTETSDATNISGFPTQTTTPAQYLPDSLCHVVEEPDKIFTNNGLSVTATVDTASFTRTEPYIIGYSNAGVDNTPSDWIAAWARYRASETASIQEFVLRDAGGSASQQIADLQEMLTLGVNAIIINPVEQPENPEMVAFIATAHEAGIPVIMVGHYVPTSQFVSYIGQDDFEVGCIMSQELISLVDGEGAVARLHGVDLSIADIRFKMGESAVFAGYPGMSVSAEGATAYDREKAASLTNTVQVLGILGYNSEIALGGQDGIAQQGLSFVPVVADHSTALARFMLDNQIDGSLVRVSTQEIGTQAIDVALQILQGQPVQNFYRIVPTIISDSELRSMDLSTVPANAYLGDWEDLPQEYRP